MLAIVALAPCAVAETPAPAAAETIEAGEIDLALEVMQLQGVERQFLSMMDALAPLIGDSIKASAPQIDNAVRDRLVVLIREEIAVATPELLKRTARLYAAGCTVADLQAARAYFRSGAAQRVLAAQTAMDASLQQIGEEIGQRAARHAVDRFRLEAGIDSPL